MARSSQKLSGSRAVGPDRAEASVRAGVGRSVRSLGFFALFYMYLYFGVDLRLLFHGGGEITNFPVFFRGWEFFRQSACCPGGIVEYISAFLSQLFYYRWAGALVVTLQAWLLCLCVGYILKAAGARRFRWVRFVPAPGLLIIYTQYAYHFATTMGLSCALVFACLYLRLARKRLDTASEGEGVGGGAWARLKTPDSRLQTQDSRAQTPDPRGQTPDSRLYFGLVSLVLCLWSCVLGLVLSMVCYYVAGGAYLLFAVVCGIYELLFARRLLGVVYLLLAAVVPYVMGVLVFGVSPAEAFTELLPVSWTILRFEERRRLVEVVYVLYLVAPVTILLLGVWRVLARGADSRAKAREHKGMKKSKDKRSESLGAAGRMHLWYAHSPRFKWIVESLVLVGAAAGAVFFSYDGRRRTEFAADYYAYHRKWPEVLRAARRDTDSIFVAHAVNRALYYTGRLGYDMLRYPQSQDTLMLTADALIPYYWKKFDMYLDLGHINLAENALTESLEKYGERPMILERLALINMVKGRDGSARVYLRALEKTLTHCGWARGYVSRLDDDPNLTGDERIQHLRSVMVEKDHITSLGKQEILLDLLDKNRHNKMAFEYLMALYLLTGGIDKVAENYGRLDDFDYQEIPELYEEALLLYAFATQKPFDLKGREVRAESHQRFAAFNRAAARYKGDKRAAFEELSRDYSDSYLFYYLYRVMDTKK